MDGSSLSPPQASGHLPSGLDTAGGVVYCPYLRAEHSAPIQSHSTGLPPFNRGQWGHPPPLHPNNHYWPSRPPPQSPPHFHYSTRPSFAFPSINPSPTPSSSSNPPRFPGFYHSPSYNTPNPMASPSDTSSNQARQTHPPPTGESALPPRPALPALHNSQPLGPHQGPQPPHSSMPPYVPHGQNGLMHHMARTQPAQSSGAPTPLTFPQPNSLGAGPSHRRDQPSAPEPVIGPGLPVGPPRPPMPSTHERRQPRPPRRYSRVTTDNGGEVEMDTAAIRFLESINDRPWRGEPNEGDIARAQQLLRGAVTMRRASKSAFASLQSVDKSELSEEDKNCCICYNEFGVTNAEGINEAPLRLPKCKHVFGDHCIKKWFEEKDTCPYCRDKVPSERYVWHGEGIPNFLREAPPNVIIGLLGAGEPREVTSGSSRRSPPEDPAEGSRRRTRPRYGSMRGPPSGRHQSTQTGLPSGPNHTRPRHSHSHSSFNLGRAPHLPPSAPAAGLQPAPLPPFPHQVPTPSQWPTQPSQGLPDQGLPGFHQFVNPYPASTTEGPGYNRPFPAPGPPEFMMPSPNDPTPSNHIYIPGSNMNWGPHHHSS